VWSDVVCRDQPCGREVENAFQKLYPEDELAYTLNVKFPLKLVVASVVTRLQGSPVYFHQKPESLTARKGKFQEFTEDMSVQTV